LLDSLHLEILCYFKMFHDKSVVVGYVNLVFNRTMNFDVA